jgi:hypothetical protein
LKFIERQHRRDRRRPGIKAACRVLNDFVVEAIRKVIELRGSHVHKWRLSDTQLDRLNGISWYMRMPDTKIKNAFTAFYNSECRKIRGQWRKWISGRIAELQKLADAGQADVPEPAEVLKPCR